MAGMQSLVMNWNPQKHVARHCPSLILILNKCWRTFVFVSLFFKKRSTISGFTCTVISKRSKSSLQKGNASGYLRLIGGSGLCVLLLPAIK